MPTTTPAPAWKRPRPSRVLARAATALALTALVAVHAPQAHAAQPVTGTDRPDDTCDMASGPEGATIGALLYAHEVLDDAIGKYRAYKQTGVPMADIETANDYICDVPKQFQGTLTFLTTNVLVFVLDVMQLD